MAATEPSVSGVFSPRKPQSKIHAIELHLELARNGIMIFGVARLVVVALS